MWLTSRHADRQNLIPNSVAIPRWWYPVDRGYVRQLGRNSSSPSPVLQGANSGHYSIVVLLHLYDVILAHHLSWCSFIWGEIDSLFGGYWNQNPPVIRFLGEISFRYALATIQVQSDCLFPWGKTCSSSSQLACVLHALGVAKKSIWDKQYKHQAI